MRKLSITGTTQIAALITLVILATYNPVIIAATKQPLEFTSSIDLRGKPPEETAITVNVNKPADAANGILTLASFDADFPTEGQLIINGNAPVTLFGSLGVKANDNNSTDISIHTPASYWNNGNNTLLFKHTSTAGFVVDAASVSFGSGSTNTSSNSFPADLRGKPPEEIAITVNVNKPADAANGILTLASFDADFPTEGQLIINGNAPVTLFGSLGVKANDNNSTDISIHTPASYWNNGNNTLLFKHTSTAGFVVDAASVSFGSGSTNTSSNSFPVDLRGKPPEEIAITVNANKPADAANGILTLASFDADFPTEGQLIINGNAPVALFGSLGVKANDNNSTDISIHTPASYWTDGNNTLLFKHTNTAGFVVDAATVSFDSTSNDLVATGPIVIDAERDVIISGKHISNPNGTCIDIKRNAANVIIDNSEIGPCGDIGVNIVSSNHITIKNTFIHDTKGVGVRTQQSSYIQVKNNQIERTSTSVYAINSSYVDISANKFLNVLGPFPRGQFVQFAFVKGAGNRINDNIGINELGASNSEDAINIYKSAGDPNDYIQVNRNIIVGGGPSKSGGGILLGDSESSYAIADGNIIVNPGATGIKISSGHHLTLSNNKVFSDKNQSFGNVGIPLGYQAQQKGYICSDINVSNNSITFWKGTDFLSEGKPPRLTPYWKWSGCGTIKGWSTNKFDDPNNQPANLDITILPTHILENNL